MMKFVRILIGLYLLTSPLISPAQTNEDLMNKMVSLSNEKETIQSILTEITKKYDIIFSYEPTEIPLQKEVELPLDKMPLKRILEVLFKDTNIAFSVHSNVIILTRTSLDPIKEKETSNSGSFQLYGKITDKSTGEPFPFVNIGIPSLGKSAISDTNGLYKLVHITAGVYEIKFNFIGFKEVTKYIQLNANTELNVALEETFTELETVTVTPGTYNITAAEPTMKTLGSKEILLSPNFAKDIDRTLRVIPGFANSDMSAKPRIRGGHWIETATCIDNFEIYEPYHFEEVDGLASILSTDYVTDIKISTGGFPAKYTDKMSGIIEVRTSDYVIDNHVSASADFLNTALFGKLRITEKVSMLFGVRRGYLDLLINVTDTEAEISPTYYDIWGKVNYQLNRTNLFSFHFLKAMNDFDITVNADLSQNFYFHNIKNNNYAWMNWKWLPGKDYYAYTTLGFQDLYANSHNYFIQSISKDNIDKRYGQILILTQNHLWNVNANHSVEFGFEWKKFQTGYRFNEIRYDLFNSTPEEILIDSVDVNAHIKGSTVATFIQDTWTIGRKIVLLPGLRISGQSYTKAWNLAPRLAVNVEIIKNLNLRTAWGIYYQPDNFEKLKSFEGQTTPSAINSKCIHYTASLDYKLNNTNFKIDGYLKEYLRLTDDFRFDVYNRIPFIIDKSFNTTRGKSKGIEFTMRQKYGKDNVLSISYALAKSTIRDAQYQETYRNFDRRHSFTVNSILNLQKHWSLSFLWMFYTGEPYTPYDISFIGVNDENTEIFFYETMKKNSARTPNFNTLDFRISKTWNFKRAQMNIYLNVMNLFNRENVTGMYYYAWQNNNGKRFATKDENSLNIPRFISPGISITF
jgi:CarboxypepD_reg-like domain